MSRTNPSFWPAKTGFATHLLDEVFSVLVGAGFTLGLFLALAYFEHRGVSQPAPVIEELRPVSIPFDTPPPPVTQTVPEPVSTAVTGIEVAAAADSPVRIAVSVPILENLPVPLAPPARIQTSALYTDFKPKMDLMTESQHVFQQSEVDQRPTVLVNTSPRVPSLVRNRAAFLRVVLLMVIDAKGAVSSVRMLNTSGNEAFDQIVVSCVQDEWVFSPAVRKGKKVKCLVQRSITVKWSTSPFES